MKDFLKKNWGKVISMFISCVALFFSGWTFISQVNAKRSYNETAKQVMINAEKIELQNLNEMFDSVASSPKRPVTNDQFSLLLSNMKENYQIVANLETTNIPNQQIMTYQFLRMNMKANIEGYTMIFNQYKSNGIKPINFGSNKFNILQGIGESRDSVKRDIKSLETNRVLKSNFLDQSNRNFESAYSGMLGNN